MHVRRTAPWRLLATLSCALTLMSLQPAQAQAPNFKSTNQLGSASEINSVTQQKTAVFRVYSANATRMEVWLYRTAQGGNEVARYEMKPVAGKPGYWRRDVSFAELQTLGFTPETTAMFTDVMYGYRAWGPNWPYNAAWHPRTNPSAGFVADVDSSGNRFNPNKLLADPFSLYNTHDYANAQNIDGAVFASGTGTRTLDSGPQSPKSVVSSGNLDAWRINVGTKPQRPMTQDVIYEVHVRGFTMNDTSIPADKRGTYAGAALKAEYLRSLGVTAVEFLPVHETENEANDVDAGSRSSASTTGDNYWGYMTSNFFAPDSRYSSNKAPGGAIKEYQAMVKAFHDKGIKVIADVVYNHTAEGGLWNSTDSSKLNIWNLRGLDNSTYYLLAKGSQPNQFDYDITGTGNTVNTRHPVVKDLILDSMRFYIERMGVDGFRFDLGIALGNKYDNNTNTSDSQRFYFDRNDTTTALAAISAKWPNLFRTSEPWGLAPGGQGYQLGNMPAGWAEWNGGFRDIIRRDQNELGVKAISLRSVILRMLGSPDLYADDGRKPEHSVNYLSVHDGLTLKDVYSCNGKNNAQPWPYGVSDGGTDDEDSWDQGSATGQATRQRQAARTGFALLSMSVGVPMLQGGDEALRSLNCNNNPYNLDSTANWQSWQLSTEQTAFYNFSKGMLAFRKAHPILQTNSYLGINSDGNSNGLSTVDMFTTDGAWTSWSNSHWDRTDQHAFMLRHDGTEAGTNAILTAYNGWTDQITFKLPWPGAGKSWYRVTDTASWNEFSANPVDVAASVNIGGENATYGVAGRSLVIFVAK